MSHLLTASLSHPEEILKTGEKVNKYNYNLGKQSLQHYEPPPPTITKDMTQELYIPLKTQSSPRK
jgi:hypothetical protein